MSNFLNQFILPATSTQPTVTTTVAQITNLVNAFIVNNGRPITNTNIDLALHYLGYTKSRKVINGKDVRTYDVVPMTSQFAEILTDHNQPLSSNHSTPLI